MHRIALVVSVIVGLGCGRGGERAPPCGAVAAKLLVLARYDLEQAEKARTVDEATHRMVTDQLPAMRDSLAHACTDSGWPAAVRTCLVDAPDRVAFEACYKHLTDPQRRALDRAALGESELP